ncbi:hypothetical protein EDF61_1148 [Arthrobacter sp. JUb115]|nr:hypothetical protein EDF61_1148 [Arthrobacter sp. JUb115]
MFLSFSRPTQDLMFEGINSCDSLGRKNSSKAMIDMRSS